MITSLDALLKEAKKKGSHKIAIVMAEDEVVLEAAALAKEEGIAKSILIGNKRIIENTAKSAKIDISEFEILETEDEKSAIQKGINAIREGRAKILMKGQVSTSVFLKGVLDKEQGLRTGRTLSHICVLEVSTYHKLLFMTDGGMNLKPDLKTKIDILKNAIDFLKHLGIEKPKVAVLAAIETVNPDMPETVEADALKKMAERGEIKDAIVEGPLAFDLAVSKEAARQKKIESKISGEVDILLVPEIATGNIFAKGLIFLGKAKACGIVVGASAPVVMLSRADTKETKLYSMALGVMGSK
ncbi:MAG: bifunctional enoyl-CoA hydratase/phosphate acetyltransferase [Candidatus Edwardsbacteria bacterium]